jgi:hypothetical protein
MPAQNDLPITFNSSACCVDMLAVAVWLGPGYFLTAEAGVRHVGNDVWSLDSQVGKFGSMAV